MNNYQDDPLETHVAYAGFDLFGGHPLQLPARRGLILPLEWQARPGLLIHYLTAEVTRITEDGAALVIETEPAEIHAEFSLAPGSGYRCDEAAGVGPRFRISNRVGRLVLSKCAVRS
jgi:hypothetical protein